MGFDVIPGFSFVYISGKNMNEFRDVHDNTWQAFM
jgi:hypothetical protein